MRPADRLIVRPRVNFLIVGSPRSGTTLVQRLACELDGVKVPHETHLLSRFAVRIGRTTRFPWSGDLLREGLRRYVALPELEGIGPNPDAVYDTLAGRAGSILDVLDAVVGAMAPSGDWTHGEKTPAHLQWARPVAAARPELKLICLVRDPRAVFLSQRETPWGWSDPARSSMRWVLDQQEVRHLERSLTGRVLILRYEAVVADPDRTRAHIGTFLGVGDSRTCRPRPETLYRPGETWKSLASGQITEARAERWRGALTPAATAAVEAVAHREMARWGYGTDDESQPGQAMDDLRSSVRYRIGRTRQDFRIRHVLSRRCGLIPQ